MFRLKFRRGLLIGIAGAASPCSRSRGLRPFLRRMSFTLAESELYDSSVGGCFRFPSMRLIKAFDLPKTISAFAGLQALPGQPKSN